jgi:N-acyl-D-aspartate/D-glutamate deacylase
MENFDIWDCGQQCRLTSDRPTPTRHKGRLQEGADADVVVFDPKTVADRATYRAATEPSQGMRFVLVGGVVLIDQGKLTPNTYPGKPLYRAECP